MWVGSAITALGIVALLIAPGGIHYTRSENYPRDGSVHITAKVERVLTIPPAVGGLITATGAILMIIAARQ
jgi:hypothetical protein